MENPATWGAVERTLHTARKRWEENQARGVVGRSLEAALASALREAGLLVPEPNDEAEAAPQTEELVEAMKTTRLWD